MFVDMRTLALHSSMLLLRAHGHAHTHTYVRTQQCTIQANLSHSKSECFTIAWMLQRWCVA